MARQSIFYVVPSVRVWPTYCGNVLLTRIVGMVKIRDLLGESLEDFKSMGIVERSSLGPCMQVVSFGRKTLNHYLDTVSN